MKITDTVLYNYCYATWITSENCIECTYIQCTSPPHDFIRIFNFQFFFTILYGSLTFVFADFQRLFRVQEVDNHGQAQDEAHYSTHPGTAVRRSTAQTSGGQTTRCSVDEATETRTSTGQQTGGWKNRFTRFWEGGGGVLWSDLWGLGSSRSYVIAVYDVNKSTSSWLRV